MIADTDFCTFRASVLGEGLTDDQARKVLGNAVPNTYGKNRMLFTQDEPAKYVFLILDGWVKVYRETVDGDDAVMRVDSVGETIGISALYGDRTYIASAEAESDVRLLPVSTKSLALWAQEIPQLSVNLMTGMSRAMRELANDLEKMKCRSASLRLIDFLLQHCSVEHGPAVISLPYGKSLIARQLGMRPESFSRVLAQLVSRGVKVTRERVQISDVGTLHSLANGEPGGYNRIAL